MPLKNFSCGHTGIRAIAGQNSIISTEPRPESTWQRGLISGSQVKRYSIEYHGHWLNIDPDKLYKGGWNEKFIKQRKILVRQTGYNIISAIDNAGYFHLNNIHSFTINNLEATLDYLLLMLNSKLLSFYYHVITMEFGKCMAQIDIETLEMLPIVVDAKINAQAANLVNIMEACVRERLELGAACSIKADAFEEYIDQLIYRIYKLSDAEMQFIEDYENNLTTGTKKKYSPTK